MHNQIEQEEPGSQPTAANGAGHGPATLRALLQTTQELNSTLDLRRLLEAIAHQARRLMAADSCLIHLLNAESGTLAPLIALHDQAPPLPGPALALAEGLIGRVAQTGVGEVANPAVTRPEALLAAPLIHRGRIIGVLSLHRPGERPFAPADLEALSGFAGQAALAVENARLRTAGHSRARELERAHEQLRQADKLAAIGQLAAGMAHELNNPLTAIMGFAQLLEDEGLPPSALADVRRILAGVGRAQRIVANLLTFARQQRLSLQALDLAALTERVLDRQARECPADGVTLRRELPGHLPELRADPFQIEQLLVLLVRQARRATAEAGGGSLSVRLSRSDGLVRLEIADQGPGIPADILPRLFDPFLAPAEAGEGQGLELSACCGIVRAHRGRIWAEPQPGRGTRFLVELPLDAAAPSLPELSLAGRPALIVSEDDDMAEMLLPLLQELGHRPSRVESGEAALVEAIAHRYDLILCDVNLPGMDIERLYRSIGAGCPGRAGRFVALSSADPGLPGVPFLQTPLDPAQVRAVAGNRPL